jgi:hypothetical protein
VLLVDGLSILETEPQNTLGGFLGDQFDRLNNTVHNLVLDAGVLSLGVLTDENGVDVVVGGLEARDRAARTDVGKEVESPTKSQVERDVTLSDGGLKTYKQQRSGPWVDRTTYGQRTLQGDLVLLDRDDGILGNGGLAVLQNRSDIGGLPLDRSLQTHVSFPIAEPLTEQTTNNTFAAAKICLTLREISGPIPSPSIKVTV